MRVLAAILVTVVAFPTAASEEIVVPFETSASAGYRLVLKGDVGGREARLVLDTGASQTLLRPELTRLPANAAPASRLFRDAPGVMAEGRWSVATIRLGGRTWPFRPVVATRLEAVEKALGVPLDGVVGQDLLREFASVTIDYRTKTVKLVP